MTRMTRELSLVLLGSGALTLGYFAWDNEEKIAADVEKQAQKRVGGNGTTHHGGMLFLYHGGVGSTSVSGGRSPAMASVTKGGFGSIGSRVGGGLGG
ncbi:hypothetical protein [Frigoriglobus tundricola]|uniref:Uncharacterized protein n=1 Tax=Frigoriglobus tundricola TaxID=2774151 RepID=A0A6M5Z5V9_9BACT|nr:hypothetical protein [Frigoriglobus tundricola]QJX00962.1 hypothetical protein FTUN_8600 [Frigoriglobus tundricola]